MPPGKTPSLAEQLSNLSPEDAASLLGVLQTKAGQTANKPRPIDIGRPLDPDEEVFSQIVTPGAQFSESLVIKGRNPIYAQTDEAITAREEYRARQLNEAAAKLRPVSNEPTLTRPASPLLQQDNGLSKLINQEQS